MKFHSISKKVTPCSMLKPRSLIMQIEYIGEILQDGHLLIPPDMRKRFKVGEKVKVRLRKKVSKKTKGLSPQAQELIRMFEEAPDRGWLLWT